MGVIYIVAVIVVGLLIFVGPILLIISLVRPAIINRFTRTAWSRKKIGVVGVSVGVAMIVAFSGIGAATEPPSMRAEREARARQEAAAKLTEEKREVGIVRPIVKRETKTEAIEFDTIEREDASLPVGKTKTSVAGIKGGRTITYDVTYVQGAETTRQIVSTVVTTPATTEIILVGTYVAPKSDAAKSKTTAKNVISESSPAPSASAYYANCIEARSAGVAPIRQGQPGYRSALDRDKDGIACE